MPSEPSDIAIAVSALVNAIGALLITLNIGLTQAQTAAIGLVLNAVFGVGWAIYKAVKPSASVSAPPGPTPAPPPTADTPPAIPPSS